MTASALVNGDYAVVTDDQPVFNGVYYKNNGSWSKTAWNSSKELSEAALDVLLNIFPQEEINTSSNLLDGLDYQSGHYDTRNNYHETSQYLHTNLIEVQHDQTYVIDVYKNTSSILNFYDDTETFIGSASEIFLKLSPEKTSGLVAVSPPSRTKYVRVSFHAFREPTMIFCKASSVTISPKLNLSDTKSRAALTDFIRSLTETGYKVLDADNIYKTLTKDNWVHGEYLTTGAEGEVATPNSLTSYNKDYIPVEPLTVYAMYCGMATPGLFYDSDKQLIRKLPSLVDPGKIYGVDKTFTTVSNAAYIRINVLTNLVDDYRQYVSKQEDRYLAPRVGLDENITTIYEDPNLYLSSKTSGVLSHWDGKTIAWYGTSIPAGGGVGGNQNRDVTSHANLAVHDLGARIINKAVGSGGITSVVGAERSFTNTTTGVNYQDDLVGLFGTADEPDLVVFDYGVNDAVYTATNWFDDVDPTNPDVLSSRDKREFIGAYNTVIDALLAENPRAKFCFITHFSDDSDQRGENGYRSLNRLIEAVAEYWAAPVLKLHEKTGIRKRHGIDSIKAYMPDGIHPASGDMEFVYSLQAILRDFLQSIA